MSGRVCVSASVILLEHYFAQTLKPYTVRRYCRCHWRDIAASRRSTSPSLDIMETEIRHQRLLEGCLRELANQLNLTRVSGPLFATAGQRPRRRPERGGVPEFQFDVKDMGRMCRSSTLWLKWKRQALAKLHHFPLDSGLNYDTERHPPG